MYKEACEYAAKKNNTTPEIIDNQIKTLIAESYKYPDSLMHLVPHKGDMPTPDELIRFVVSYIKYEKYCK